MKPAAFDYYCPDTIEETVNLLSEYGDDSLLLAGGLSLDAYSSALGSHRYKQSKTFG